MNREARGTRKKGVQQNAFFFALKFALDVRHRHDFVALLTARRLNHCHIALFFANECACYRAADVDQAQLEIGFIFTDNLILDHVARAFFFQLHSGTKTTRPPASTDAGSMI